MSQETSSFEGFHHSLLTVEDVAAITQQSVRSIWRMRSARQLPAPIRVGQGAVRWRKQDIEAWIKAGCPSQSSMNLP